MAEDTTTDKQEEIKAKEAPDAGAAEVPEKPAAKVKKKNRRNVPFGQLHIQATFNNTIISVTDPKGAVLTYSSAGACGFRGSKKGTAYAAQIASEKAITVAKQNHGISKVDVFVKGTGLGREAAIRALQNADVNVESIRDVTGIAHGGTRPKKARRV